MRYGEPHDEKLAAAMQEIENELTGDMVMSFVGIAKVKSASDPDSTSYRTFYGGDPDVLVGLSMTLSDQTRDWMRDMHGQEE